MSYATVDTASRATRASGDLIGQIGVAMLKRAGVRISALADSGDQKETGVCRSILDGSAPTQWTTIVLVLLDVAGQLATPTDAQVDTQVAAAFAYFIKSRG